MQIDEKKFCKFFLTNFLKGYFRALPDEPFFSKKYSFVFYQNFGFNFGISSNNYFQLKKQVIIDPETSR